MKDMDNNTKIRQKLVCFRRISISDYEALMSHDIFSVAWNDFVIINYINNNVSFENIYYSILEQIKSSS